MIDFFLRLFLIERWSKEERPSVCSFTPQIGPKYPSGRGVSQKPGIPFRASLLVAGDQIPGLLSAVFLGPFAESWIGGREARSKPAGL